MVGLRRSRSGRPRLLAWAAYARARLALDRGRSAPAHRPPRAALSLLVAALLRPVASCRRRPRRPRRADARGRLAQHAHRRRRRTPRASTRARAAGRRRSSTGSGRAFRTELAHLRRRGRRASLDRADAAGPAQRPERGPRGDRRALSATRRWPAVIVLSDGGDTSGRRRRGRPRQRDPRLPVGVGAARARPRSRSRQRDGGRAAAGRSRRRPQRLGRQPRLRHRTRSTLRLTANGRPVDVRRVAPAADGAPVHTVFTVSPAAGPPTVYTVDIAGGDRRARRREQPPQRARAAAGGAPRILIVEGAPGYEHTFLKRALAARPRARRRFGRPQGPERRRPADRSSCRRGASRAAALSGGYPVDAGCAVPVRRHRLRQRRSGVLHARAAGRSPRVRRRARRRAAGARRALVRARRA